MKITIHMVSSLDGYIAKKDNSISWFETSCNYDKGITVNPHEAADFLKAINCYVMGSRTYELAVGLSKQYGWPYGDTPTIVLTHRNPPVERPNIEIYSGDLNQLVTQRLAPNYQNIWLVGGAALAKDFIRLKLAHEIRLSVLPVILGGGVPFLNETGLEQALNLKNVIAYKSGMVELHYEIKK